MTMILTEQDCDEHLRTDSTVHPDEFEILHAWDGALDSGWCREIQLRDLWLTIKEYQAEEDFIFKAEPVYLEPASSFFVAGTMKSCYEGFADENLEAPGRHYVECVHGHIELDHQPVGEKIIRVRFGLNPDVLKLFGDTAVLPRELQPWATGEISYPFYRQGTITAEMQVVLHQILHCIYQGPMKQMYLEGKVLELAALQFSQFAEVDNCLHKETALKSDDIERLHQAKEILMAQINDPPSILGLSRQVGLNDFKLKQGFRQVFGTTVFGYLREYRLEQARLLLIEGELSVQQVARAIGYTHSGYFATAFKHKFGISPKTYQSLR
ncbi:helix-turn-helix transcriptional regulator [Myxacorys almedinensis]|uniref:Helix-turn-helix domain-containing protein n=1 Tax=Myxacorys almedinensis A TaxID=2690445 RepID=A0A8J8CLM7_9CYAN|nr:AraC family transcriptional regulator [Myxacorys almedinensis]NDJ19836.1 helix-turn-helix domain-containing protein [Myxacorys almedinensis A]